MWYTVRNMGFAAAHQPRFRVFCCLLAAFWTGMILLGAVRLAFAVPTTPHASRTAAATPAASRCPMCAAMAHAGMKSGMKCCCRQGGGMTTASCVCACRPQPQPATLAVLVWSPLAVLPAIQAAPTSFSEPCLYPALSCRLCTVYRSPQPRPPRSL